MSLTVTVCLKKKTTEPQCFLKSNNVLEVVYPVPGCRSVCTSTCTKESKNPEKRKPCRELQGCFQACSYSPCWDGVYVKVKKLKEEKTVWSRVWASSPRGLIYLPVSSNYSPGLKFGLMLRRWTERIGEKILGGKGRWRDRSRDAIALHTLQNSRQSWNGGRIRYSDTKWTNMAMTEMTQRSCPTMRPPTHPSSSSSRPSPSFTSPAV